MKRIIVGALLGLTLGAAVTAGAASQWRHSEGGILCASKMVNGDHAVLCIPMTGTGYGTAITRNRVVVANVSNGKVVFARLQP